MTHNNNYLCISLPSTVTKPIVQNSGAVYLQSRSMPIITVQAPMELNPRHSYELSSSDDLSLGLIPLAVDHRINHKCPKSLNIPILSMAYNKV